MYSNMKSLLFIITLFAVCSTAIAQDSASCEVSLLPITGKYTGECKSNKAHGLGKSVGMDTYEGEFKKGYPDGEGIYTWKNGNFYSGTLKKGLRNGKGTFHFVRPGLTDSVVTGYWQKDTYKGLNLKPYIIVNTTSNVNRVDVKKLSDNPKSITVLVHYTANTITSVARMTSVNLIGGRYFAKATNELTKSEITVFQQVEFPFRAVFVFGNAQVEIEFFDEGEWTVDVPINRIE
jgi:MORN repeat